MYYQTYRGLALDLFPDERFCIFNRFCWAAVPLSLGLQWISCVASDAVQLPNYKYFMHYYNRNILCALIRPIQIPYRPTESICIRTVLVSQKDGVDRITSPGTSSDEGHFNVQYSDTVWWISRNVAIYKINI